MGNLGKACRAGPGDHEIRRAVGVLHPVTKRGYMRDNTFLAVSLLDFRLIARSREMNDLNPAQLSASRGSPHSFVDAVRALASAHDKQRLAAWSQPKLH